jgi:prepilin peptidase CpaA
MEMVLIAGLGIASMLDWKYRKVPNWLTFFLAFTGFIFQFYVNGTAGFINSLAGFGLGIALLYLPFTMGGMGGGDVKLMGAIGAFTGPVMVFHVFLASALFGGLMALIEIARTRSWKATFGSLKERLLYIVLYQKIPAESQISFSRRSHTIPYAIMITCGYLWNYFFPGGLP